MTPTSVERYTDLELLELDQYFVYSNDIKYGFDSAESIEENIEIRKSILKDLEYINRDIEDSKKKKLLAKYFGSHRLPISNQTLLKRIGRMKKSIENLSKLLEVLRNE